jgi:hypothetical protein
MPKTHSLDQPPKPTKSRGRLLFVLFGLLLLAGAGGLWLATGVFIPTNLELLGDGRGNIPTYFQPAILAWQGLFQISVPIAISGMALLVVALINRGPAIFLLCCRGLLYFLGTATPIVALYALVAGGVVGRLALVRREMEVTFYKRSLDHFALLETAQGRFEKLRNEFETNQRLTPIEIKSVKEFTDSEAREKISEMITVSSKTEDIQVKRRMLATLALFCERILPNSTAAKAIPKLAAEAGTPILATHMDALAWIAENKDKDGWEPLPLFRLTPR